MRKLHVLRCLHFNDGETRILPLSGPVSLNNIKKNSSQLSNVLFLLFHALPKTSEFCSISYNCFWHVCKLLHFTFSEIFGNFIEYF